MEFGFLLSLSKAAYYTQVQKNNTLQFSSKGAPPGYTSRNKKAENSNSRA